MGDCGAVHDRLLADCAITKEAMERYGDELTDIFNGITSLRLGQQETQQMIIASNEKVKEYHKETVDFRTSLEPMLNEFRDFGWFRRSANSKKIRLGILLFLALLLYDMLSNPKTCAAIKMLWGWYK